MSRWSRISCAISIASITNIGIFLKCLNKTYVRIHRLQGSRRKAKRGDFIIVEDEIAILSGISQAGIKQL